MYLNAFKNYGYQNDVAFSMFQPIFSKHFKYIYLYYLFSNLTTWCISGSSFN